MQDKSCQKCGASCWSDGVIYKDQTLCPSCYESDREPEAFWQSKESQAFQAVQNILEEQLSALKRLVRYLWERNKSLESGLRFYARKDTYSGQKSNGSILSPAPIYSDYGKTARELLKDNKTNENCMH